MNIDLSQHEHYTPTDGQKRLKQIFLAKQIMDERKRQDAKWGNQFQHPDAVWSMILGEEVGEVHKDALENNIEGLRAELIQVAAVAMQWIEALDYRAMALDAKNEPPIEDVE